MKNNEALTSVSASLFLGYRCRLQDYAQTTSPPLYLEASAMRSTWKSSFSSDFLMVKLSVLVGL